MSLNASKWMFNNIIISLLHWLEFISVGFMCQEDEEASKMIVFQREKRVLFKLISVRLVAVTVACKVYHQHQKQFFEEMILFPLLLRLLFKQFIRGSSLEITKVLNTIQTKQSFRQFFLVNAWYSEKNRGIKMLHEWKR